MITDPNTDVDLMAVRLLPEAIYSIAGIGQPGYDNLVASWADGRTIPTDVEINAEQVVFLAEDSDEHELTKALRSKRQQLLFEMNYDQESRLRVLGGSPAITKPQYKAGILVVWKTL